MAAVNQSRISKEKGEFRSQLLIKKKERRMVKKSVQFFGWITIESFSVFPGYAVITKIPCFLRKTPLCYYMRSSLTLDRSLVGVGINGSKMAFYDMFIIIPD